MRTPLARYRALGREDWTDAVGLTDEPLADPPQHPNTKTGRSPVPLHFTLAKVPLLQTPRLHSEQ